MQPLLFIKAGGSIITDKCGRETANPSIIRHLAHDLQIFRATHPEYRIVFGHGSGSFGHQAAAAAGIRHGLTHGADWMGVSRTSAAVHRLNRLVMDILVEAGIPAFVFPPSASLLSLGGAIQTWHTDMIERALQWQLIPVIHGDVVFDMTQGCAIFSTEALFVHLARHTELRPLRIVLLANDAVWTADPHCDRNAQLIPHITCTNIATVLHAAGDASGVDVTGGMRSKVEQMWGLVAALPHLEIQIVGYCGQPLQPIFLGERDENGTLLRWQG